MKSWCLFFSMLLANAAFSNPPSLTAHTEIRHLRYVKIGSEIGAGYRFHKNAHGADLSVNYASMSGESWTGGRALYLFYPFLNPDNGFYIGAGTGITYGTLDIEDSMPPLLGNGKGGASIHNHKIYPTLETTIGYEFFAGKKITLFTQIDLSIPFGSEPLPLFINGPGQSWKPTISLGIGF